ncbi:glycoside hydrolase superfamily [Gongronella butleri]|nr:glycoside hydrolase superfamily [Gongronella butleri]
MMFTGKRIVSLAVSLYLASIKAQAASIPDNAVSFYWGQNSAAAGGSGNQESLATYCDGSADVILLSFLTNFNVGGLPTLNFASACENTYFDGTTLLNCPNIGKDIKTCQGKGKKILLSIGGAAGSYGFSSDDQASQFATTLYDMFGGGSHKYRPFGDAQVDGFDFDIEGGGATGYATLAKDLKAKDSSILITAAPQCPFPDAMLGDALDNAPFDAVWVQFYNNYCSASGSNFNFDTWDNWAKTKSPNKDVKVFLGLPGSSTAAGTGYIDMNNIKSVAAGLDKYDSYGGIMFWDASQAYSNTDASPNLAAAVANLVHDGTSSGGGGSSDATTTTTDKPKTSSTTTDAPTTKESATTTASASSGKATTSSGATKTTDAPTIAPTTTSATETTTTTSAAPPASSSGSSSCGVTVKNGAACSTEGQYACAGSSFGICDHGAWVVQPCASGLACFATTDSSSVYCAQPASGSDVSKVQDTCEAPKSAVAPKPYKGNLVQAQLSVVNVSEDKWSAVVNARRTKAKPFDSKVVVSVQLPNHMTIESVSTGGKVIKNGSKATLQVKNPQRKSMDLVFTINGSIEKGAVFVAPTANGMTFH